MKNKVKILILLFLIIYSKKTFSACSSIADVTLPTGVTTLTSGTYQNSFIVPSGAWLDIPSALVRFTAGRKIEVQPGGTLTITNSTLSLDPGCSQMWHGIELQSNSIFYSDKSEIADADYGLFVHDQASVDVNSTIFNMDLVGIYVKPNSSTNTFPLFSLIDVDFQCLGTLNTPWSSPFIAGDKTYVGLYLNDCALVIDGGINLNYFAGINIGIYCHNATLDLSNSIFNNILPDVKYGNVFDGTGIYCYGSTSSFSLTETGIGQFASPSFDFCRYGIYTQGVDVDFSENNMTNVNTGVHIRKSNSNVLRIQRNDIYNDVVGIDFHFNEYSEYDINHNNIYVNTNATKDGIGIYIAESDVIDIGPDKSVVDNYIRTEESKYAIYYSKVSHIVTRWNIMDINLPAIIHGVAVKAGHDNYFSCNTVFNNWTNSNPPQCSFYFISSVDNILICNHAKNGSIGFNFDGYCGNTQFVTSEMKNNQYRGLLIGPSGFIGLQSDHSNEWTGTSTSAECDPSMAPSNQFFVNPFSAPYIPTTIFPPSLWFNGSSGGLSTGCLSNCPAHIGDGNEERRYSYEEFLAATQNNLFPVFSNKMQATSARELLNKTIEFPDSIPDYTDSFRLAKINTDLYSMLLVENSCAYDLSFNENQTASINLVKQNVEDLLSQIKANIQLYLNSTNVAYRNSILVVNANLQLQIQSEIQGNIALVNSITSQNQINLQYKLDALSTYIFNEEIYSNEKFVTELILKITYENYDLTQTELQLVHDLAQQCSLTSGSSVFTARNIYKLYFPESDFDDAACGGQFALRTIKKSTTVSELPLYPNPATNEINIGMTMPEFDNIQIVVRNNMSQIEKADTKVDGNGQIKLDISSLQDGLYYLQLKTSSGILKTGTFIKMK
ncbi:MAG TPA: T9SS type A sorting domain-containing protein [Bacteroidia bacterium]|nr:T9SS type A sorting domain-containing protein [Bacteroidia bacterium]